MHVAPCHMSVNYAFAHNVTGTMTKRGAGLYDLLFSFWLIPFVLDAMADVGISANIGMQEYLLAFTHTARYFCFSGAALQTAGVAARC